MRFRRAQNSVQKLGIFIKQIMSTERRHRLDLMTPAEIAIQNATCEVVIMGADEKLIEAVILLQKAKELVADFVDSKSDTVNPDPKPPKP